MHAKVKLEDPQTPLQFVPLERTYSPQIPMCLQPRAASPGLKLGRAFSPRTIRYHPIFREIKSSEFRRSGVWVGVMVSFRR